MIAIEDDGFYSSLDPWEACPNANNDIANIGIDAAGNWSQIYLKDTVSRLQTYISGVELDTSSVFSMQELCVYETVALGYSTFCDLFTDEEWEGFDYAIGELLRSASSLGHSSYPCRNQTLSSGTAMALGTQHPHLRVSGMLKSLLRGSRRLR